MDLLTLPARIEPEIGRLYDECLQLTEDSRAASTLVLANTLAIIAKRRRDSAADFDVLSTNSQVFERDGAIEPPNLHSHSTSLLDVEREREAEAPPDAGPFTVRQAAAAMNVDDRTVYSLCSNGELAHHRIGVGRGTIRISQVDLQRYLSRQRVEFRVAEAAEDHLFGPA